MTNLTHATDLLASILSYRVVPQQKPCNVVVELSIRQWTNTSTGDATILHNVFRLIRELDDAEVAAYIAAQVPSTKL